MRDRSICREIVVGDPRTCPPVPSRKIMKEILGRSMGL
jgi:hypothetical protein